jgi:hypothetical protein
MGCLAGPFRFLGVLVLLVLAALSVTPSVVRTIRTIRGRRAVRVAGRREASMVTSQEDADTDRL